jgi:hypothetical protein
MAPSRTIEPGLLIGGGVLFLSVVGVATWFVLTRPPDREVIRRAIPDATTADSTQPGTTTPAPQTHAAAPMSSSKPAAARSANGKAAVAPPIAIGADAAGGEGSTPARSIQQRGPQPQTTAPSRSASTAVAADGRTFGAGDRNVTPPVPLNTPEFTPIRLGLDPDLVQLEVVVNERGFVESAKVTKDPQTLADTMLYSMALQSVRSWRFVPATLDGRPVRYRNVLAFDSNGRAVPR